MANADGDTLQVVMTRDSHTAGDYRVSATVDGQTLTAGPVTVERAGPAQALTAALTSGVPTLLVVALFVGLSLVLLKPWVGWSQTPGVADLRGYLFAGLTIVVFCTLIDLLGRQSATGTAGPTTLFRGSDGRASTSKTQYLAWTFVIGFALAYDAARATISPSQPFECDAHTVTNCVTTSNWGAYLLLLGLPAGAAVVSKGLVSYRVSQGTMQKVSATNASLADLTNDDAGRPDIVDIQYLLFNLIAIVYVVSKFLGTGVLPTVPDLLLGLTSTSAATYVLNKGLQTNAPVIRAVTPPVVAPGQSVTISGDNLFVDATHPVVVLIGGIQVPGTADAATKTVRAIAPAGMQATDPTVRVITDAQVQTDPYPIQLSSPKVIGWILPVPRKDGGQAGVLVSGLAPEPNIEVLLGDTSVTSTAATRPDGTTELRFRMPAQSGTSVQVAVATPGDVSSAVTLPLASG